MIALALALLAPQDTASDPLSPGNLISKMFAKYHSATRIRGTVVTTVKYGDSTLTITSTLQIERPSKVYLLQVSPLAADRRYLVTSDGVLFSYDKPISRVDEELNAKGRLVEPVDGPLGKLSAADIYRAATESIAERSLPLDVAFAHSADLGLIRRTDSVEGLRHLSPERRLRADRHL
jgi:outer membrane lipoprotein-sorting protein